MDDMPPPRAPTPYASPERRYGVVQQASALSPSGPTAGGKAGRYYPWGTAESENEDHSDLRALRRLLVTDGLLELRHATQKNFEAYRRKRLQKRHGWRAVLRRLAFGLAQLVVASFLVSEVAPIADAMAPIADVMDHAVEKFEDLRENVREHFGAGTRGLGSRLLDVGRPRVQPQTQHAVQGSYHNKNLDDKNLAEVGWGR
mmetsp:Transcript_18374/g.43675  ORF Transcript_18374/g.43675 Transcript_18374/m.43675 type:complete len:201 (-) Transcript_18374:47-649(-)